MRIKRVEKIYENGDIRHRKKFLFKPLKFIKKAQGEKITKIYWLECVTLVEKFNSIPFSYRNEWELIDVEENKK